LDWKAISWKLVSYGKVRRFYLGKSQILLGALLENLGNIILGMKGNQKLNGATFWFILMEKYSGFLMSCSRSQEN